MMTLLVVLAIMSVVNGQCTANAGLGPTSSAYLCPLGYVNSRYRLSNGTYDRTCKLVSTMVTSVNEGRVCFYDSDCMSSSDEEVLTVNTKTNVYCRNGQCVYASQRLPGDSCDNSGQCISSARCDSVNSKTCILTTRYTQKKGQRCNVAVSAEGITLMCLQGTDDNLKCLLDRTNGGYYCHSAVTVGLGQSCVSYENVTRTYNKCKSSDMWCDSTKTGLCTALLDDGLNCTTHSQCKNGDCQLTDPTDANSGYVCKTLKTAGAKCDSTVECTNTLTCRSTSKSGTRTCTSFGDLGDYCSSDAECTYNKRFLFAGVDILGTSLTRCSGFKCIRRYGRVIGETCEIDVDCHSGYCDPTSLTCKVKAQTCTAATNDCPYCACTTSSTGTTGLCVNTACPGHNLDLKICLFNNFITTNDASTYNNAILSLSTVAMDDVFLDTSSSVFKTCGVYYTNLLKCLKNDDRMKYADVPGYSLSGSAVANVNMPKIISSASQSVVSFMVLIVALIAYLF